MTFRAFTWHARANRDDELAFDVRLFQRGKRAMESGGEALCAACVALDIPASVRTANQHLDAWRGGASGLRQVYREDKEGEVRIDAFAICRFGTRLTAASPCRLCSFFRAMRIQVANGSSAFDVNYKLLAICNSVTYFLNGKRLKRSALWPLFQHDVFMIVAPDIEGLELSEYLEDWIWNEIRDLGAIHLLSPTDEGDIGSKIYRAREVSELVDFSILQGWLSFCSKQHGFACSGEAQRGGLPKRFRVINCTTTPASLEMQPSSLRYAALSYVWGTGPSEDWPRVVLDAVEVTRKLGFQFLWVDRLCIDQDNPEEKLELISKMAEIYECADYTIVAAAGSDANYGLPGVRSLQRPQRQEKVTLPDGSRLVSTMADPKLKVQESVWSGRGWTYQEGVLSYRRLVFTDEQVYFECRGMSVWESIEVPLNLYHEGEGSQMSDYVRSGIFQGMSEPGFSHIDSVWGFRGGGWDPHPVRGSVRRLDDHIYSFSQRNLTYDGDSLLAFEGIAHRYASGETLGMLAGIPLLMGSSNLMWYTFAASLSFWGHTGDGDGDATLIGENEFVAARRRPHLPSWTWAGWKGKISWAASGDIHSFVLASLADHGTGPEREPKMKAKLLYAPSLHVGEFAAGRQLPHAGFNFARGNAAGSPGALIIFCPFLLAVEQTELGDSDTVWFYKGYRLRVKISTGATLKTLKALLMDHQTGELCSVLLFCSTSTETEVAQFLVCRRLLATEGYQRWERIGRLDFPMLKHNDGSGTPERQVQRRLPLMQGADAMVIE